MQFFHNLKYILLSLKTF